MKTTEKNTRRVLPMSMLAIILATTLSLPANSRDYGPGNAPACNNIMSVRQSDNLSSTKASTGISFIKEQDNGFKNTLLSKDINVTEMWVPEVKINSIQGKTGTLVGFYGGALFNRTLLLGIAGGVNLGHPTVNYGYFGGIVQAIANPGKVFHFSGQILLAYGTTKDYEDPKTGLLDDFWNISGESFFITEPGLNIEVNLSERVTFITGASYRYVTGIDSYNENIPVTRVTNEDMSGFNFNIGLKFTKRDKKQ
ncbi:MAG: hypothetical protein MUD02_02725 [Bacteroidales bacterium]|nr:hypothetical protein [Bacteroidales bacterium]